jgi:hypothetical protein
MIQLISGIAPICARCVRLFGRLFETGVVFDSVYVSFTALLRIPE